MKNRRSATVLAVLVMGWPGVAGAQGRRLDIEAGTLLQYDSNFARSSRALADLRGIEPEELRISPTMTIRAELPVGRHALFADGTVGYDFHLNNPRFDKERLEGRGGFRVWLSRCRSTIEGRFARRQSELEDILEGPLENAETTRAAALVFACPEMAAGLVPGFELEGVRTSNSSAARRTTDSEERRVELRLDYLHPALGSVGLFGEWAAADYPSRLVANPMGALVSDEFRKRTIGFRLSRELGSVVRGSVGLGHTRLDTRAVSGAFSGLTWTSRIQINPMGRLRLTLAAERAVQASKRVGVTFQLETLYRAELRYLLSERTSFELRASRRHRDYQPAVGVPPPPLNREQTSVYAAAVDHRLTARLSAKLQVQHELRDANQPIFEYSNTRIALSITGSY